MSTAQKRGFRLPWSNDREPAAIDPDEDAKRLTAFLHAASDGGPAVADEAAAGTAADAGDELGDGPFQVAGSERVEGAEEPVGDAVRMAEPGDEQESEQGSEEVVLESVVEGRGGGPESEEPVSPPELMHGNGTAGWPVSDRQATPAAERELPLAATPPARAPRRDNPLVAGLVRAMREAAEASRGEAIAALQEEAAAQIEAIKASSTTDEESLRKQADEDIAAIREWAKAETARIRQESEQRISDRREANGRELEEHTAAIEARIAEVQAAVASYEAEMDRFFENLLAENDPARLASLAERAPEPPDLAGLPGVRRSWTPAAAADPAPADIEGLAPEAAAVAEAEALEGLAFERNGVSGWPMMGADGASTDPSPEGAAEPEAAQAETVEAEAAPAAPEAQASVEPPAESSDATATDAAATDAPVANDEQPGTEAAVTVVQLVVEGLSTVAGISAFKGALAQLPGVEAVSVSAGERGTFVFSVTHGDDADLRSALPELPGFAAHITADEGSTLRIAAQEPTA